MSGIRFLDELFQHPNLFIFSFTITRVKMAENYAVVLLFLIITFVLVMLLIIAYLGLLMCRIYYTEITQTQPHRRSLKRITGFKRSNMSREYTTTNNVVGFPVWKFMLRMNYITSRHLSHATYEDILMKYNCFPSYCHIKVQDTVVYWFKQPIIIK